MPKIENRHTFLERLRNLLPAQHLLLVDMAYTLAKHAHRYAKARRSTPEDFERQRRVAIIIVDEAEVSDIATIVTALLKEAVSAKVLDPGQVATHFGPEAANALRLLTGEKKNGPDATGGKTRTRDWRAELLRAASLLERLRNLNVRDRDAVRRLLQEAREQTLPLLDGALTLVPRRYRSGAKILRAALAAIIAKREKELSRK